jgi:hypothetical protein
MDKKSRDEHGYVKGGERSKIRQRACDAILVTRTKERRLPTSSSKPNVPRLLPMPPDADVGMGTADGSGISLSLIFSKNDMMGDGVERDAL